MERLTMFTVDGYESINPIDLRDYEYSNINFKRILDKLGPYEDMADQGRLIELPCKVGDKVYAITRDFISEYEITGFSINRYGLSVIHWHLIKGIYLKTHGFYPYELGKEVFLTREEAEEKLKFKSWTNKE